MDTSRGWGRARLKLQGLDLDYKSLKEAYYQAALEKQRSVEAYKDIALIKAAAVTKDKDKEGLEESIQKYLHEKFPSIDEDREDFFERGSGILEEEAGKVFTLGGEED